MTISLEALIVLDAIDRGGSFAAAANALHRVPSAITYQIRRLEEELDALIYDRRGHRARLTPAGQELLVEGRRLLGTAAELEQRVRQVASGWEAELAVAVDTIVPACVLVPLVDEFHRHCAEQRHVRTRLRLSSEVLGGTWESLLDGRADLAIGAPGDPPPGMGLRARRLAVVEEVFAVAPGHPLATLPEPLSREVVVRHRAVAIGDTSRRLPRRSVGLDQGQDTLTVADLASKLAMQEAGLGCGFLPRYLAAPALAAGRLLAKAVEEPKPGQVLNLAWKQARPGKALSWWIRALEQGRWTAVLAG